MKSSDSVRLGGIILALALSLALSACSAIKLGYNTLPELAYWWLDGYADFGDEQQPLVRAELARLHGWHRRDELPRIAEVLARMEQLSPGDITPQQACGVVADAQLRLQSVVQAVSPGMGTVAASLAPRQLRHMERKFRSSNDKFRAEMIDVNPAQAQEKRYEQMLERIEMVYGRLEEPQRAVLRQGIAASTYDGQRILGDRQRRQQDLLETLRRLHRAHLPPEQAREQLLAWFDRAQHAPDPAYRAWQQGLVDEGCRIFAAVHASTTAQQREQAVRRLRAYQRDLRDLSAQSR
jgi:hypothetical protein